MTVLPNRETGDEKEPCHNKETVKDAQLWIPVRDLNYS